MPVQEATSGRGAERLSLGQPFEQFPSAQVGAIGTRILTPFGVSKKAAAVSVIKRTGWLRRRNTRHQDGSAFGRDTFALDELSYSCDANGWESPLTKAKREVYRSDFDADYYARQLVADVLDREKEIRIAAQIFDAVTNWPSGTAALYTDVSTDWDSSSADIIGDIARASEQIRRNCGLRPNTLVLSAAHIPSLQINTGIAAWFKVTDITAQMIINNIGSILGIPNVLFGEAVYNSADEGQALTMADVWSDDYAWLGITASGTNLVQPCVGRTLFWDAYGADGREWAFYTEQQTKSDVWQAEEWTDEVVFDAYFGHLLKIDT